MVVNCEQVWQEISNYLEGEANSELRSAMEAHVKECRHCAAVLDGTKNVIQLYGDDRWLQLPVGFSPGWRRRLAEYAPNPRGTALGWILAVAAVALVSGSFALARLDTSSVFPLRSYLAEPGTGIPDAMMVAVSADGKTFHVPGCRFLHKHENENVRLMAAAAAIREGYVPCVRCLRQYLNR
jgi:anti-sigma factor RsiW